MDEEDFYAASKRGYYDRIDVLGNRLKRMSTGADLARISVRLRANAAPLALSCFRRDRDTPSKRCAVLMGGRAAIDTALAAAAPLGASIAAADLLIVPIVLETAASGARPVGEAASAESIPAELVAGGACVASVLVDESLRSLVGEEVVRANEQGIDPLEQGLLVVIKKNGRVGQRAVGAIEWAQLTQQVAARGSMGMDVKNI